LTPKVFVTGASPDIGAALAIASSDKGATFGFATC
jgi:NAD(P)-dependent dehydrogenase (short-subunit alcohol dehydrogenase family)